MNIRLLYTIEAICAAHASFHLKTLTRPPVYTIIYSKNKVDGDKEYH